MGGQFGFGTSGSSPGPRSGAMFGRAINYRVREVRFSVVRESASDPRELSHPSAVVQLVRRLGDAIIPDDAREHFVVLMLSAKNRLVAFHRVSTGTLSGTLVQPREVFGPALRTMGVASIVLVHNHPSGDPTPSREDIRLTRQLADAGRLLDLPVHDHVVIGDANAWLSFSERGLLCASRAGFQVPAGHQSQDGARARTDDSAVGARARRRDHRVTRPRHDGARSRPSTISA